MAFDFASIVAAKPKTAPTPVRTSTRAAKPKGPNPWLDPAFAMNITRSYEDDVAFGLEIPGALEMLPAQRGKNKGQPVEKVTGDAHAAIALIRDAATKLDLGVAVRTLLEWDEETAAGKTVHKTAKPGHVYVVWHARDRKQTKPKGTEAAVTPES